MMRRIDLLPASYVARRRERRNVVFVFLFGAFAVLLLIVWFLLLSSQISDARDDLAAAQARNQQIEAQIAELQVFAELEAEVQSKRTALQTVFAGDLDWPAMMTEIAMVIPGDVWLESFRTSAGATEGAAPAASETNPIRLSNKTPFGRIDFNGNAVCMPGVPKWLIRLGTVKDFSAIWLTNATEQDSRPGCEVVNFQSTVELSETSLSKRFQGELE